MIDECIIDDKCSECGWNKKPENARFTPCELDHINGNPCYHRLENLRLLCPNCHSLTNEHTDSTGVIFSPIGE